MSLKFSPRRLSSVKLSFTYNYVRGFLFGVLFPGIKLHFSFHARFHAHLSLALFHANTFPLALLSLLRSSRCFPHFFLSVRSPCVRDLFCRVLNTSLNRIQIFLLYIFSPVHHCLFEVNSGFVVIRPASCPSFLLLLTSMALSIVFPYRCVQCRPQLDLCCVHSARVHPGAQEVVQL